LPAALDEPGEVGSRDRTADVGVRPVEGGELGGEVGRDFHGVSLVVADWKLPDKQGKAENSLICRRNGPSAFKILLWVQILIVHFPVN
jgi:hypothetical protein